MKTTSTVGATKFCRDCKWCNAQQGIAPEAWYCTRPIPDLVAGIRHGVGRTCRQERDSRADDWCGADGRFWEAREKGPQEVDVAALLREAQEASAWLLVHDSDITSLQPRTIMAELGVIRDALIKVREKLLYQTPQDLSELIASLLKPGMGMEVFWESDHLWLARFKASGLCTTGLTAADAISKLTPPPDTTAPGECL